jgi:integrase
VPSRPKINRIADGCFAAVIRAFMASPKFRAYSQSTQDTWGRELRLAERPDTLGALSVYVLRPALVQGFLDGLAEWPGKQVASLSALKQVEKWAIVRDHLPHPITTGVEVDGSDGGHTPWNDAHVDLAERFARPDLAQVVTLKGNTGQRGSDIVKMRWTDIEEYEGRPGINVIQKKTGKELWIPLTKPLQVAIAKWERRPGFIVRRPTGLPWTRKALSDAWTAERENNESLSDLRAAGLVLHGLRATACVRLLRAGANTRQIADMVGMSEATVAIYCRLSLQRANAIAAIVNLDGTPHEPLISDRTKTGA